MSDPDKKERSGDLGAYVPSSVDMVPTINSYFPPSSTVCMQVCPNLNQDETVNVEGFLVRGCFFFVRLSSFSNCFCASVWLIKNKDAGDADRYPDRWLMADLSSCWIFFFRRCTITPSPSSTGPRPCLIFALQPTQYVDLSSRIRTAKRRLYLLRGAERGVLEIWKGGGLIEEQGSFIGLEGLMQVSIDGR